MKYDVIIIDGKNMAYKAYYVNKYLKTIIDGETVYTGMMYGFLNMLTKIHNQFAHSNTRVMVCWDVQSSADANKEILATYKANRIPLTPEEIEQKKLFEVMMNDTKKMLQKLNIYQYQKNGVEADDVCASLAYKLSERYNKRVLIVTEDKDYRQLINDKIQIYGVSNTILWDVKYFQEKYQLKYPATLIDYLALVGDSSDGYKGVNGVGNTLALKILNNSKFDGIVHPAGQMLSMSKEELETFLSEFDITNRQVKIIVDGLDDMRICYKLAELNKYIKTISVISPESLDYATFLSFLDKYKIKNFGCEQSVIQLLKIKHIRL